MTKSYPRNIGVVDKLSDFTSYISSAAKRSLAFDQFAKLNTLVRPSRKLPPLVNREAIEGVFSKHHEIQNRNVTRKERHAPIGLQFPKLICTNNTDTCRYTLLPFPRRTYQSPSSYGR
ncbi:hypothetical protein Trydic_g2765 [Trypoxylus dichotomus]